jgi:hypothetical protein
MIPKISKSKKNKVPTVCFECRFHSVGWCYRVWPDDTADFEVGRMSAVNKNGNGTCPDFKPKVYGWKGFVASIRGICTAAGWAETENRELRSKK